MKPKNKLLQSFRLFYGTVLGPILRNLHSLFSFYIILGGKISIFIINKDNAQDKSEESDAFAAIGTRTPNGTLDRSKLGNFVTHLGMYLKFISRLSSPSNRQTMDGSTDNQAEMQTGRQ